MSSLECDVLIIGGGIAGLSLASAAQLTVNADTLNADLLAFVKG